MACRRSLTTKASAIRSWYHASLGHIVHQRAENDETFHLPSSSQPGCGISKFIMPQFHNQRSSRGNGGVGALFGGSKCYSALPFTAGVGPSLCRYMSSTVGEGSDHVDHLGDVADILTDNTVEVVSSQAPAVNEVAIAATDSSIPVAAIQYLIDAVHSFTGLNCTLLNSFFLCVQMACRRSLTTKASAIRSWYHASLGHIVHQRAENDETFHLPSSSQPGCGISKFIMPQFHNQRSSRGNGGVGALFGSSKCYSALPFTAGVGPSLCRYMSSTVGEGSDHVDHLGDVADILTDNTVEVVSSQAPAVNEVAIAATDSSIPVAAIQYLIDAVHSFTGLNWWAAIAISTILIRGATLPAFILQLKATYKYNEFVRPRLMEMKQKMDKSDMHPIDVAKARREVNYLFQKYGVGPFTPWRGLLLHGPIFISFFFAISNMVEKVPSFKAGGAFWFTDLTTPDSLYIFPVLASLSLLITMECNMLEGLEGNYPAHIPKSTSRVIAFIAVPITMSLPKAFFCYWITSNLFRLSFGLAFRRPEVRKFLDLPVVPTCPASPSQSQSPSVSAFQQHDATKQESKQSPESSKFADRSSELEDIKQRIRNVKIKIKKRKENEKP